HVDTGHRFDSINQFHPRGRGRHDVVMARHKIQVIYVEGETTCATPLHSQLALIRSMGRRYTLTSLVVEMQGNDDIVLAFVGMDLDLERSRFTKSQLRRWLPFAAQYLEPSNHGLHPRHPVGMRSDVDQAR